MAKQVNQLLQSAAITADIALSVEKSAVKVAELTTGASDLVAKLLLLRKNVGEVASKVAVSAERSHQISC